MARMTSKALLLALGVAALGGAITTAQGQGDPRSQAPNIVIEGGKSKYLVGKDACTKKSTGTVAIINGKYQVCTGPKTYKALPDGGHQYDDAVADKLDSIKNTLDQ